MTNSGTDGCSGVQKFWQGIEVWGNHNLPQNETNQGVVELKNEGIIEYARNGIRTIERLTSGYDWSKTGGIVRCMSGTFKDCRRGLEFSNLKETQLQTLFVKNICQTK